MKRRLQNNHQVHQLSTRYPFQGLTTTEEELVPEDAPFSEDSSVGAGPPKLKLFGCDVLVTDVRKPSPSSVVHTVPSRDTESNKYVDMNVNNTGQEDCSKATGQVTWGPWPTFAPTMFYCLNMTGNLFGSEEPFLPLPWWAFYGGLLVPPSHLKNMIQTQLQSFTGGGGGNNRYHQEGSGTASDTISMDKSSDAVDSNNSSLSIKLRKN